MEQTTRVPCSSLPKFGRNGVLVIHRRVLIDMDHPQRESAQNYSFECTIIPELKLRKEPNEYRNRLFQLGCIRKYVNKSNNNLIISLLVPGSGLLASQGQHTMSQLSCDDNSTLCPTSQLIVSQRNHDDQSVWSATGNFSE